MALTRHVFFLPLEEHPELWLRVPLEKSDDDVMDGNSGCLVSDISPAMGELYSSGGNVDTWEWWNAFCLLCAHHSQLSIALDVLLDIIHGIAGSF
ncbi:hypothetical protein HHK36_030357 [Tetracentron sinense]|uniref:PRMT5 TIM barrel domain-containing protein n=1 Tax=Tetracentron sinense TaxID=13715 RepID=A0A834YAZ0_TETSI|nr:hypothetical protein HHK36_030357 [Tetracentron sinense]